MLFGQKRLMSLDRLFRVESGDSEHRLCLSQKNLPARFGIK